MYTEVFGERRRYTVVEAVGISLNSGIETVNLQYRKYPHANSVLAPDVPY